MTKSYTLGVGRWIRQDRHGKTVADFPQTWVVPGRLSEEDVVEQLLATPDPSLLAVEHCGGVPPTNDRGSIWWWAQC